MKRKIITFYGNKLDLYGMPEPYFRYLIVLDKRSENTYMASIIPLSESSKIHFKQPERTHSSVDSAFNEALKLLKNVLQFKGLKIHVS